MSRNLAGRARGTGGECGGLCRCLRKSPCNVANGQCGATIAWLQYCQIPCQIVKLHIIQIVKLHIILCFMIWNPPKAWSWCAAVLPQLAHSAAMWVLVVGVQTSDAVAQLPEVIRPPVRPSAAAPAVPVVPAAAANAGAGAILDRTVIKVRPPARPAYVPRTRWQHMEGHVLWTRAAMSALKDHGSPLVSTVPRDIADWCPAYPTNDATMRSAFWVGYLSALAKHESTYKPWAVGGGGKWYGLLQILPATARGYKCNVGTGEALKSGPANLSCGVRIMAHTVKHDGVIHGRDSKWRGVSADWGPMRNPAKRRDMAG